MRLIFKTEIKKCPDCNIALRAYRTYTRHIRSIKYGHFEAVHRLMLCRRCRKLFKSEVLGNLVGKYCTYANDVMVRVASMMSIEGESSSEVSSSIGISEGHARKMNSQGLDIFASIHEKNIPRLRKYMKSYILQIDGTTDSEFSMIVAVKDPTTGFVLYVKRCDSESEENIVSVLETVKERFGNPSGITCDMRSGILSAAQIVFHNIPIRICLMHFLRDLGKDLMKALHTVLGLMINHRGIKSPLKKLLRSMPDYNQKTLEEVASGSCSSRKAMEIMAIRRILENIMSIKSSGYGFPFSLRHINFFTACVEGMRKLKDLTGRLEARESIEMASTIIKHLSAVVENTAIMENANKLKDLNSIIFQRLRKVFMVPDHGNLPDDSYNAITDDPIVHENCTILFGELEVYLKSDIKDHMFKAAKLSIERYRNRETMLFAQNADGTIPRTNNNMEIFFRKIRRNVRKRCGNTVTGNILTQSGDKLALFQNMANEKYREIVFENTDIGSVFAEYRKPFKKEGMTKKREVELVNKGTEMIMNNTLNKDPYKEWASNKSHDFYKNIGINS